MINIETKQKDIPKNKTVLLFSGGMDSVMYNKLLNPDILLYIKHGNKYENEEIARLEKVAEGKLTICNNFNLKEFERDDAIIPNRNLYFITLATHYGENILLGSVYGDRTLDKSLEFYAKLQDVFNYLFQEQHWCEARTFHIDSPFKSYTKTELLRRYLQEGYDIDLILESYSCYEGKKKQCGWCKPCFRKWVALQNNNINTDGYFKNKPSEAEWLLELLPLIKKGAWRGREDTNILEALKV